MPRDFRDVLEKHPLRAVIVVAVAAGSLVFGVMSYFHEQQITIMKSGHSVETLKYGSRMETLEADHKNEIKDLAADHRSDMEAKDQEVKRYRASLRTLRREVSSIPSGTGFAPGVSINSLVTLVDPDKMEIDRGKYELLRDISGLRFFANVDPDTWTYSKTTEASHTADFTGIRLDAVFSQRALSEIQREHILKWEPSGDHRLVINFKEMAGRPFTVYPFITVQFINANDNFRYLRLLSGILSPHIVRAKKEGLASIVRLVGVLEAGTGLTHDPAEAEEIGIYRSRNLLGHVLFFILVEAHQTLLFENRSQIVKTNVFDAHDLFVVRLRIREEDVVFADGSEGELWVTRDFYVLKHPDGHIMISAYMPSKSQVPDPSMAKQMQDWVREFRVSQY